MVLSLKHPAVHRPIEQARSFQERSADPDAFTRGLLAWLAGYVQTRCGRMPFPIYRATSLTVDAVRLPEAGRGFVIRPPSSASTLACPDGLAFTRTFPDPTVKRNPNPHRVDPAGIAVYRVTRHHDDLVAPYAAIRPGLIAAQDLGGLVTESAVQASYVQYGEWGLGTFDGNNIPQAAKELRAVIEADLGGLGYLPDNPA